MLEDSSVRVEHGGPEGDFHSVTFGRTFDADELMDLLTEPLDGLVPRYGDYDVRDGLRALTYPNSRVVRNTDQFDPNAPGNIVRQRSQIQGLLEVIDHPRHHEMVPAKVHVLSPFLAELATKVALTEMKPTELRRMCEEHGIHLDHMKMWRLKGGNRHNHPVNVGDFGVDADALAQAVIAERYRPKTVIPGEEPALVPVEDLPEAEWAHDPGYVELLRTLPPLGPDDVGDRWQALLRREGTPRHVVRPRIVWGTRDVEHTYSWLDKTAEYHRQRYSWNAPHTQFFYDDAAPEYSPATHTVVHTSSLLGPVMLAGQLGPETFRHEMDLLRQGRHWRYWNREDNAPRAAGAMIALLQSPYIMARIMGTSGFRNLRRFTAER